MEIFLVLFLLSGQFKAFLQFFGLQLPVDITVLTAAIVLGITIYKLLKKNSFITLNISFFSIGLLLLFYSWMIFSLFYSASEEYSTEKTFYFLLNITAFSVPFFFKEFNIRLFIKAFTVGIIILAIGLLPFQYFDLLGSSTDLEKGGTFSAIGGLYLTLSEYLGLIVILFMTKKEEVVFTKRLDVVVVVMVVFVMMLLGARGPVIFALIVYALYYLNSIHVIKFTVKKKTIWWMVMGAVFLLVAIVLMTRFEATETLLNRSIYRFTSLVKSALFGESQDHSAHVRILLMQQAMEGIFQNIGSFFFGYGIGSFGIISQGFDIRLYPHNMILEIWFELGLIGLALFLAWIVFVLSELRRLPNRFITYWLLLYIFLNLMKSSSLIDIRTEFAIFALFTVQNFLTSKEKEPAIA